MSDRIKVRVTARQTVCYDQVLSFTKEDWDELKQSGEMRIRDDITDRLDLRNVCDSEPVENVYAVVVDGDNKAIDPVDVLEAD